MNLHVCVSMGCQNQIPLSKLFCSLCWFKLPRKFQDDLVSLYVPGESFRRPTREFSRVVLFCQNYLEILAGRMTADDAKDRLRQAGYIVEVGDGDPADVPRLRHPRR